MRHHAQEETTATTVVKKSKWDVFVDAAGELVKGLIGWDDIKDCVTQGAFGACVRTLINFIPWGKVLKAGEIIADFWKGAKALITFGREVEKAEKVITDTEKVLVDAERAADAAADAEKAASEIAHGASEAKGVEAAEGSVPKCSVVAGTQVVLADGSTKPIEDVKTGDVVLTTDPATGETGQHRVVGTDVHGDEPPRTEITVESGGKTGSIAGTDWHPFWVDETGGWVEIGDLVVGEHLHTPDGRVAVVTEVKHFIQSSDVYDLTVDTAHDFYIMVGAVSVLTHNCGGLEAFADSQREVPGTKFASEYTSPSGKKYFSTNRHGNAGALEHMPELKSAVGQAGHHGGCAEVGCLIKAYEAEGPEAISGGSMRTVHVRNPRSSRAGEQGMPATPCGRCQRLLGILGISW